MLTSRIVHLDGTRHRLRGFFESLLLGRDIPRVLEGVVHPLCQGVMDRIARLGHADAAVLRAEQLCISGRGVLHASVAVVDHVVGVDVVLLKEVECLVERTHAAFHLQGGVQAMADNASAEGIGEQRQVGEATAIGDVGDVRHDQVARSLGLGVEEVIVLVIGMVRVRSARAITALAEHQVIGTEQGAEAVSSDVELLSEVLFAQEEELPKARLREVLLAAQVLAIEHNARLEDSLFVEG